MNLDVQYAFGGDRACPLVARTLRFPFDPFRDLQVQLLERADALVADVWAVQDAAFVTLDDPRQSLEVRGHALNVVLACIEYVVSNLLHPTTPTPQALQAFDRIQDIFRRGPLVSDLFSVEMYMDVLRALDAPWKTVLSLQSVGSGAVAAAAAADAADAAAAAAASSLTADTE
jgi:hypothetical protein